MFSFFFVHSCAQFSDDVAVVAAAALLGSGTCDDGPGDVALHERRSLLFHWSVPLVSFVWVSQVF